MQGTKPAMLPVPCHNIVTGAAIISSIYPLSSETLVDSTLRPPLILTDLPQKRHHPRFRTLTYTPQNTSHQAYTMQRNFVSSKVCKKSERYRNTHFIVKIRAPNAMRLTLHTLGCPQTTNLQLQAIICEVFNPKIISKCRYKSLRSNPNSLRSNTHSLH